MGLPVHSYGISLHFIYLLFNSSEHEFHFHGGLTHIFVRFVLIYFIFLWYPKWNYFFKFHFPLVCKYLNKIYFYANMVLSNITKLCFYSDVCL